jgi:hypothetical protein
MFYATIIITHIKIIFSIFKNIIYFRKYFSSCFCIFIYALSLIGIMENYSFSKDVQKESEKKCKEAENLLGTDKLQEAVDKYNEIIKENKEIGQKCAKEGFVNLTKKRYNFINIQLETRILKDSEAIEKHKEILKDVVEKGSMVLKNSKLAEDFVREVKTVFIEAKYKYFETRIAKANELINDKLEKKRFPDQALKIYKEVLDDQDSPFNLKCEADNGIIIILEHYIARGDEFKRINDLNNAVIYYNKALSIKDDYQKALNKLQEVQKDKLKNYYDRLFELNKESTIFEDYLSIIKTNPSLFLDFKKEVDYINSPIFGWRWFRQTNLIDLKNYIVKEPKSTFLNFLNIITKVSLFEIFVFGIEIIIIVFLGYLFVKKFIWGTPSIEVKEFPKDDDNNKTNHFPSILAHILADISENITFGSKRGMLMVSAPISSPSFDVAAIASGVTGLSNLFKALDSVFKLLFCRRSLTIKGNIHDISDRKGFTIELKYGNRILSKHTVWESDLLLCKKLDDPWEALAIFGAIWSLFILINKPFLIVSKVTDFFRRLIGKHPNILGTRDWESCAFFFLGNMQYDTGKEGAKNSYLKALSIDPMFDACRMNLARIYHTEASFFVGDVIEDKLKDARKELNYVNTLKYNKISSRIDPCLYTYYFISSAVNFDISYFDQNNTRYIQEAFEDLNSLHKLFSSKFTKIIKKLNIELERYIDWREPVANCIFYGFKAILIKKTIKCIKSLDPSKFDLRNDITINNWKEKLISCANEIVNISSKIPSDEMRLMYLSQELKKLATQSNEIDKIKEKYKETRKILKEYVNLAIIKPFENIEVNIERRVDFFSLYNLACSCCSIYNLGGDESRKVEYKKKCLKYLRNSLELSHKIDGPRRPNITRIRAIRASLVDASFGSLRGDWEFDEVINDILY